MKILAFVVLLAFLFSAYTPYTYGQFYQKADYGEKSTTRKNEVGGYDYYDSSGTKTGYSQKTYKGDYVYYDNAGNKLGALKKDKKEGTYTYYNADNIATGTMRKTPMGDYRYTDKSEGGLRSITPPGSEDIGFMPPDTFREGSSETDLQGEFKE